MCGFFAIMQKAPVVDLESARQGLNAIAHRGPDASGEWREGEVFLGHRRLSIIDLATGDQPMRSHDGRYVIVFNGEIYNFLELRTCLLGEGAVFRTRSDTEVILEGYRRWGRDVVAHLNGMFAFVIWDRENQVAFGARDRVGIKPLCWTLCKGTLIVSSTLEPFKVLRNCNCIDLIAVRDLLAFDYISAPRTIFQGVHKMEPGSKFEWHLGDNEVRIEHYWRPPLPNRELAAPEEMEIEALLDQAVKRQMVSDVPVGVLLSGGIDSSLLVAMMTRHADQPVRTFSVAFNEVTFDESAIARVVAERFETNHTVLHAEEIGADTLLDLLGSLDEPFCDAALVPTYALSKITKQHVKVALSGDGGDEVFGGYPKYLRRNRNRSMVLLSTPVHRALEALPWRPRGMSHFYWRTLSSQDQVRFLSTAYGDFPVFRKDMRQVLNKDYHHAAQIEHYFQSWERRARRYGELFDADTIMRADLETYLSGNCLVKTDRASMLASLEVRVPFLDELVLDRVLPLPAEKKIVDGQLKALLLPIVRRLLPRDVWDRPKHGFNVPLHFRLATCWRAAVETALDWGESNLRLFNYSYLRRLHLINLAEGGIEQELWNPFVFLAWAMRRSISL
jgi:asparagine synthase (glutamine-hydrolysing)